MGDKSAEPTANNAKPAPKTQTVPKAQPGEGIRSLQSTALFRAVNFELYAKPNIVVMVIGATCFASALGYMAYMRYKYEKMGYYVAQKEDGSEMFTKKRSKWE